MRGARLRRFLLLSLRLAGGAGRAARVPRRCDRLLLDVALGHEADKDAVGPVVPGHPVDNGYQVGPWCGVTFGGGGRLAPGFAGRGGAAGFARVVRTGLARGPVVPVVRGGVARRFRLARAGERDDGGVGFRGRGRARGGAVGGGRAGGVRGVGGSGVQSRRGGGLRGGGSGIGGLASRDVHGPGTGGSAGGNRGFALRLGADDGGRDGLGRLAALVGFVIEPGVASRPVVVLVACPSVT